MPVFLETEMRHSMEIVLWLKTVQTEQLQGSFHFPGKSLELKSLGTGLGGITAEQGIVTKRQYDERCNSSSKY